MKKINRRLLVFTLAVLMISAIACGQFDIGIETPITPTNTISAEEIDSANLADRSPSTGEKPEGSNSLSWIDTAAEAGYSLPVELSGLVYRQDNNIWLVGVNGTPVLVAADNMSYGRLSPDLSQLVYIDPADEAEDLVLLDLNTKESRQLTDTPNVYERSVRWWPAQPGVLIFNLMNKDELGPWSGLLGAYQLDKELATDLDIVSRSWHGFSLSPDGNSILYDDAGKPVLYRWNEGIFPLDLTSYGVDYTNFSAPAWSPDGKTIAFHATRTPEDGGPTEAAFVLVNLETGQTHELHPHHSIGQRGPAEIAFSSDGRWLAVVIPGEMEALQGPMSLWVLAVDQSEEHYLGFGTGPLWNPSSERLLFTLWPDLGTGGGSFQEDAHTTMVEAGKWTPQEIVPLTGSSLQNWFPLP